MTTIGQGEAVDDEKDGERGRRQTADRTHGEVDLTHQQDADDAERDNADDDALHKEVLEVAAG